MPDIFVSSPEKKTVLTKESSDSRETPVKYPNNNVYIFSSLAQNPSDISFKNQEKDEVIILFVRKHFFTNLNWILISVAVFFVPFLLSIANLEFVEFPQRYFFISTLFYYLLLATYVFVNFITWFYNISFVTNRRIVDVDFSGIIYKNVAATKISQIEDVNYDQTGVFATFFNYGDVLVQTAGEQKNFDFQAAPKPGEIVHTITNLIGGKRARL